MPTWQEYMVERIANREEGVPWFLHDKLKCYKFCEQHELATVTVLREFASPDDIRLDGLPDEYVIKPTLQSSTKGVMVLSKTAEGLWDSMSRRFVNEQEIIAVQRDLFEQTHSSGKKIIVERKIVDVDGHDIPRDFKAYACGGKVALILEINRNTKPSSVSWFDGDFMPVTDDRVTCNPEFTRQVEPIRPQQWREILDLARKTSLAIDTPFASIDMYSTPNGPLVGEITLTPGGIYHGRHYSLSAEQQLWMGKMWEEALDNRTQTLPTK